jgi:hypothetical protein
MEGRVRSYQVYSLVHRKDSFADRFKRDSSFEAIREGVTREGHEVTDVYSAGFAAAQEYATKRWGKTAEAAWTAARSVAGLSSAPRSGLITVHALSTRRASRFKRSMNSRLPGEFVLREAARYIHNKIRTQCFAAITDSQRLS